MRVLTLAALLLMALVIQAPAEAAATTWTVDRAGDGVSDGAGTSGTLRYTLLHAKSGDTVLIGDIGADSIFVSSTLVVPPGVSVGHTRAEPCGSADQPRTNVQALPALSGPIVSLGEGATWRNISISNAALSGPRVAMKIAGADVDVCAVAFGLAYDPEGKQIEVAAPAVALIVDGPEAIIHRNLVKGGIVVTPLGDGTRVGDPIGGSGEANTPLALSAVTVGASANDAARRVTIRDPFVRGLEGLLGAGVSGGDDLPNHANHWALTPSIQSALSSDGFKSVTVHGQASPRSLVDVFFRQNGILTRQSPVQADDLGAFVFSGPLPGPGIEVLAVSTLNDPANPARIGSSSQLSAGVNVQEAATGEPLLSALGSVSNLSRPGSTSAYPGERIRLNVSISNVGAVPVQQISGVNLQLTTAVAQVAGSAAISGGGSGFVVSDSGFSGGQLGVGQSAVYSLEADVISAQSSTVIFSIEVGGTGTIAAPVIGRMQLLAGPGGAPQPMIWLPLLS